MSVTATAHKAKQEITSEASKASPWLIFLVRGGYVAKGILYGFIGILAAMAALNQGGKVANQRGAMDTLAIHPLGPSLLYGMAVGLAAYSTWLLLGSALNSESEKPFKRIAHAVGAFVYYGFAFAAFEAARGGQDKGSGMQRWTPLIDSPGGRVVAVAGGCILAVVAVAQAVKAMKLSFMKDLSLAEMGPRERRFAEVMGVLGICARSVIFLVTGWLFIRAGVQSDGKQAGGMSKSLEFVAGKPGGHWFLLAVALGLIAYGLHKFVQARYRTIKVSPQP
jgi:uncharacterized membrane protein